MPIVAGDIAFRLSGGAGNSDPNASIGGAKSSTAIVDATTHNLFDVVSSAEASAGDTEYRCYYVHNGHGSLTWQSAVVWIQANTPSGDTDVAIGLDPAGVNGTAATPADESTAPAGVTFSQPANEGAALAIGDIPAGQHQAVWVRRVVTAAASAANDDNVVLRHKGDTAA